MKIEAPFTNETSRLVKVNMLEIKKKPSTLIPKIKFLRNSFTLDVTEFLGNRYNQS